MNAQDEAKDGKGKEVSSFHSRKKFFFFRFLLTRKRGSEDNRKTMDWKDSGDVWEEVRGDDGKKYYFNRVRRREFYYMYFFI